jgi:hypothetical protein
MMKLITIAVAMAVVLSTVVALPSPAAAQSKRVKHGAADYAYVSEDHFDGYVCDNEKDGHIVEAWFKLGNGQIEAVTDLGGSDKGCTKASFPRSRTRSPCAKSRWAARSIGPSSRSTRPRDAETLQLQDARLGMAP